jgi:hypothetical protein
MLVNKIRAEQYIAHISMGYGLYGPDSHLIGPVNYLVASHEYSGRFSLSLSK